MNGEGKKQDEEGGRGEDIDMGDCLNPLTALHAPDFLVRLFLFLYTNILQNAREIYIFKGGDSLFTCFRFHGGYGCWLNTG